MEMNYLPLIVAALIPTITGMIWYHKSLFGTAWMNSIGKTEAEMKEGFNMPLVMVISLIMSFFLAFLLNVILETGHKDISDSGELIFNSTHTFGHGAFHGFFYGLLFAMPILILNGMFERKSWKNIFIHVGYWVLTLSLMAGLVDVWN